VTSLAMNEIGRVRLRTKEPVFYDQYTTNRQTGSFILVDEVTNATAGGGLLIQTHVAPPARSDPKSPNVVRHTGTVTREMRFAALALRGATVWLTGLSGSGKSTIGAALEHRLVAMRRPTYMLDGDNLRHGLCGDLGFSQPDRAENVRRAAHAAQLLSDAGLVAIVTLISPYAADRGRARRLAEEVGAPFVEVHVATTLEECERRDAKGLYARARKGELTGFTGVDEAYEAPESPDVRVEGTLTTNEAVERILEALRARGILGLD
jgi:bifunctional enzyme CysN/CysC